MSDKKKSIPVRSLYQEFGTGIAIAKVSSDVFQFEEEIRDAHRHDYHFFGLQEKGTFLTEIDFEQYLIKEPSILYQSPNQVHRALKVEEVEVSILIINDENLKADYRKLLQGITPVKPLALNAKDLSIIQQAFSLCLNLYERSQDKLHFSQLQDACNALIALIISQYMKQSSAEDKSSRFEIIEKAFTQLLEYHYSSLKRPLDYAKELNISVSYLNECVKNVTGFSVSHQIQQRIVLEAKRLLYHTDKSVKEIATELGFEDYAYFSRLFAKVTGVTASDFRNKNHD